MEKLENLFRLALFLFFLAFCSFYNRFFSDFGVVGFLYLSSITSSGTPIKPVSRWFYFPLFERNIGTAKEMQAPYRQPDATVITVTERAVSDAAAEDVITIPAISVRITL